MCNKFQLSDKVKFNNTSGTYVKVFGPGKFTVSSICFSGDGNKFCYGLVDDNGVPARRIPEEVLILTEKN